MIFDETFIYQTVCQTKNIELQIYLKRNEDFKNDCFFNKKQWRVTFFYKMNQFKSNTFATGKNKEVCFTAENAI